MSENAGPEDEMQAIEELLPWYAAGTLDAASARRVEQALAREPKLQASLRLVREDRDETVSLNQKLGAPSPQIWARVLAGTQAEPRKPTLRTRLASLFAWTGAWANPAPARLAWAGAAAAVVIVLQGAAIVSLLPAATGPAYQTASQPPALSEGATVLVAFAPAASLQQVGALLQKHKASIVDGPRGGGLFRLRVGDKTMTKEQLDAIVSELRADPNVSMVLPSSGR
jgi:anti-sigma-K factor RskA